MSKYANTNSIEEKKKFKLKSFLIFFLRINVCLLEKYSFTKDVRHFEQLVPRSQKG